MVMACWLPVAVERPVEELWELFLVLVEPMGMERPLLEKELEKPGHHVPR